MALFHHLTRLSGRALVARIVAAIILVTAFSSAAIIPASAQTGTPAPLPPGVSRTTLRVKFVDGTVIPPGGPTFPAQIASQISKVKAQFGQGKARLDGLRNKGRQRTGRALPDLTLWYTLTLKRGADAAAIVQALQALPEVEHVNGAALPLPPPSPDFSGDQGYLGSLGAMNSWAYDAAGAGQHVTIYDLEYSWNTSHEDLTKADDYPLLLDPGDVALPFGTDDHGTGVLGEMIADNNGFGVTGIAYNATIRLAPVYTTMHGYNLANAIVLATLDANPGDVILIEQQAYVCNSYPMMGPSEWDPAVWDAIRTATDNGITVVEAAGNGHEFMWLGQNLDAKECQGWFKTSHDSGAIIVGAGQADTSIAPRSRMEFSDYGKRVNVQAWGEQVVTTGYGNLHSNGIDTNADYAWDFSGTSSASPMVAATVANMQSLAIELRGEPLTPEAIRSVLVSTGKPQTGNTKLHIGPQVDAAAAIAAIALARPAGASAALGYSTSGVAKLTWQKLKHFDDQYQIKIDDNPDFLTPEFSTDTTATSVKVSSLPFGDYFWQVAALDVDGGALQVTALKSPGDNSPVFVGSPTFKWNAVPGATQYTIEIDTVDTFDSPGLITGTPPGPIFTPPAPLDFGTYYWRIRATAGAVTGFTPAWTFHRTLISAPGDGVSTVAITPKLAWKASPGATEYEVKIADNAALASPTLFNPTAPKLMPALDYGRWFWNVRASAGATTPETPIFAFEITALSSPKDGSVTLDTTPTFKWRAVPDAGTYQIVIGTGWDQSTDTVLSPVLDVPGLTKTTYTPLVPLTPRTTYYWQVITTSGKTMPVWSFREP